jgi:hypothetical protein
MVAPSAQLDTPSPREDDVPILAVSTAGIGALGLLYILLLLILGLRSIKHGHWIMFLIGIPIPLFWVIGGLMPPVDR